MKKFFSVAFIFLSGWILDPIHCQCGKKITQGKIVGGVDTGGYQYPWFAMLLLKKKQYLPVPVCAGSLITPYHVLTAAHCFTVNTAVPQKDLFQVALGVYNICNDGETSRQIFDVDSVALHEKYERRGKFHDIALIKLNKAAGYVSICLPIPGVPDLTEIAVLIGFGVKDENSGFVPCHMMEGKVLKYSRKDCSKTKLPSEDKNEPSVICAGVQNGGVDSCYGDSGGPLQTITSDGRYVISGIVSYGYGCGTPDVPGIYTNVGSYLDWINNKIITLGSKESNNSDTLNTHKYVNQRRKETRRRPRPESFFTDKNDSPTYARERVHDVQYFDSRVQTSTSSVFDFNSRTQNRNRNTKNDSRVIFPL